MMTLRSIDNDAVNLELGLTSLATIWDKNLYLVIGKILKLDQDFP